ncbi:DUF1430 domain-containing protein [Aerococcaceae bacterium WGS1372]
MRIISGESFLSVMFCSFFEDLRVIAVLFILAVITGIIALASFRQAQIQPISLLVLGLLIFCSVIIFSSFILSTTNLLALKRSSLTDIIKGKLPLNQLLTLMLIGQLVGVIIVGFAANQLLGNLGEYQEQVSAEAIWSQNSNRFNLRFGQSIDGGSTQEMERRNKIWYEFSNQAVENNDAMLVADNLDRFNMGDISDGLHIDEYDPNANTIYVTPNYLMNQNIPLEESVREQLMNMEEGQFGLLLPNKLKDDVTSYIRLYTNFMQGFGKTGLEIDSEQLFDMTAITAFIADNQERFLFNTKHLTQSLTDPIIVVVTPKSMGNTFSSQLFWAVNIGEQTFFNGYEETIDLLKAHDVYPWISYATNEYLNYLSNMNNLRMELILLIAGSFLGIASAILLFSTMNLIYFEKFRRDIFIKKLAGMSFIENHQMYLLAQIASLGAASLVIMLLTRNILITLGTILIFLLLGVLIIYKQIDVENKLAVTVMKGK